MSRNDGKSGTGSRIMDERTDVLPHEARANAVGRSVTKATSRRSSSAQSAAVSELPVPTAEQLEAQRRRKTAQALRAANLGGPQAGSFDAADQDADSQLLARHRSQLSARQDERAELQAELAALQGQQAIQPSTTRGQSSDGVASLDVGPLTHQRVAALKEKGKGSGRGRSQVLGSPRGRPALLSRLGGKSAAPSVQRVPVMPVDQGAWGRATVRHLGGKASGSASTPPTPAGPMGKLVGAAHDLSQSVDRFVGDASPGTYDLNFGDRSNAFGFALQPESASDAEADVFSDDEVGGFGKAAAMEEERATSREDRETIALAQQEAQAIVRAGFQVVQFDFDKTITIRHQNGGGPAARSSEAEFERWIGKQVDRLNSSDISYYIDNPLYLQVLVGELQKKRIIVGINSRGNARMINHLLKMGNIQPNYLVAMYHQKGAAEGSPAGGSQVNQSYIAYNDAGRFESVADTRFLDSEDPALKQGSTQFALQRLGKSEDTRVLTYDDTAISLLGGQSLPLLKDGPGLAAGTHVQVGIGRGGQAGYSTSSDGVFSIGSQNYITQTRRLNLLGLQAIARSRAEELESYQQRQMAAARTSPQSKPLLQGRLETLQRRSDGASPTVRENIAAADHDDELGSSSLVDEAAIGISAHGDGMRTPPPTAVEAQSTLPKLVQHDDEVGLRPSPSAANIGDASLFDSPTVAARMAKLEAASSQRGTPERSGVELGSGYVADIADALEEGAARARKERGKGFLNGLGPHVRPLDGETDADGEPESPYAIAADSRGQASQPPTGPADERTPATVTGADGFDVGGANSGSLSGTPQPPAAQQRRQSAVDGSGRTYRDANPDRRSPWGASTLLGGDVWTPRSADAANPYGAVGDRLPGRAIAEENDSLFEEILSDLENVGSEDGGRPPTPNSDTQEALREASFRAHEKIDEEKAATKIQAAYRGHKARRELGSDMATQGSSSGDGGEGLGNPGHRNDQEARKRLFALAHNMMRLDRMLIVHNPSNPDFDDYVKMAFKLLKEQGGQDSPFARCAKFKDFADFYSGTGGKIPIAPLTIDDITAAHDVAVAAIAGKHHLDRVSVEYQAINNRLADQGYPDYPYLEDGGKIPMDQVIGIYQYGVNFERQHLEMARSDSKLGSLRVGLGSSDSALLNLIHVKTELQNEVAAHSPGTIEEARVISWGTITRFANEARVSPDEVVSTFPDFETRWDNIKSPKAALELVRVLLEKYTSNRLEQSANKSDLTEYNEQLKKYREAADIIKQREGLFSADHGAAIENLKKLNVNRDANYYRELRGRYQVNNLRLDCNIDNIFHFNAGSIRFGDNCTISGDQENLGTSRFHNCEGDDAAIAGGGNDVRKVGHVRAIDGQDRNEEIARSVARSSGENWQNSILTATSSAEVDDNIAADLANMQAYISRSIAARAEKMDNDIAAASAGDLDHVDAVAGDIIARDAQRKIAKIKAADRIAAKALDGVVGRSSKFLGVANNAAIDPDDKKRRISRLYSQEVARQDDLQLQLTNAVVGADAAIDSAGYDAGISSLAAIDGAIGRGAKISAPENFKGDVGEFRGQHLALHLAKHPAVVKHLLRQKANLEARQHYHDYDHDHYYTALQDAVVKFASDPSGSDVASYLNKIILLVAVGANDKVRNINGLDIYDLAASVIPDGTDYSIVQRNLREAVATGKSMLIESAYCGNVGQVRDLLAMGADPTSVISNAFYYIGRGTAVTESQNALGIFAQLGCDIDSELYQDDYRKGQQDAREAIMLEDPDASAPAPLITEADSKALFEELVADVKARVAPAVDSSAMPTANLGAPMPAADMTVPANMTMPAAARGSYQFEVSPPPMVMGAAVPHDRRPNSFVAAQEGDLEALYRAANADQPPSAALSQEGGLVSSTLRELLAGADPVTMAGGMVLENTFGRATKKVAGDLSATGGRAPLGNLTNDGGRPRSPSPVTETAGGSRKLADGRSVRIVGMANV